MEYDVNDFIGVFDGVFEKEYCDDLINKFEFYSTINKTQRRVEDGYNPVNADNNVYFIMRNLQGDTQTMMANFKFLQTFNIKMWECYDLYTKKYGVMKNLGRHQLNPDVKIQKTLPSEGYHVWHCEHGDIKTSTRVILVMLYLNDVEEGGETEFLYQSRRIEPKMGRLVFCPAFFTHTHRGNPPLKGNKYMMNGWLQYYHEIT